MQSTRQTIELAAPCRPAVARGAGEWVALSAVLLLRGLAIVVLASPVVLAAAWLLG